MNKLFKDLTQNKVFFTIISILLLILSFGTLYLMYNINLLGEIEKELRLISKIIIFIIALLFIYLSILSLKKKKKILSIILIIFMTLYSGLIIFVSINFQIIYEKFNNITTKYINYSASLVTLIDNNINNINDIGNDKIGMINITTNIDGYIIPKEIINELNIKNEIIEYHDFIELLEALYNKEIKYIFIPTNYKTRFKNIETFKNLENDTKIIYTKDKKEKNTEISNKKTITEPFTILLMGVDSELENISSGDFNGDALMLITFNPNTLNSTILSIPRDTYVPITCLSGKRKNKINSAAWYGEECMIDTIENLTGIKIDYHAKLNFKGLVKLVDSVGGIELDVPYSFCEQDSNRKWGNNTIYVEKGHQTLNGEQALAFSRNRHPNPEYCESKWTNYDSNDFIRGQNQQTVVVSLLNKLKTIRSIDTMYSILDTVSNNMETNMTFNQITSFYNIGKDIITKSKDSNLTDIFNINKLFISGYDSSIYDYSTINNQGTKLLLYQFIPYKGSINDCIKAMKVNLGLLEEDIVKTFAFDINNPYEKKIIGKGYYNESVINLVPDFVGGTEDELIRYANKHNININKTYVTSEKKDDFVGKIISQTPRHGMDLDNLNKNTGISVTIVEKINIDKPFDYTLCALEENKENSNCLLGDFVGLDISEVSVWEKKYKLSILVDRIEIDSGNPKYNKDKEGKIINQSVKAGTSLYNLINKTIKFEYIKIEKEDTPLSPIIPNPNE